jgi:hypothetical protein
MEVKYTPSQTKIEIRKILDEVYETGYAWGDGSKPELNANDVHEKALAAIQSIVQAAEVRARISELKKLPTRQKNDFYQIEIDPDFATSHVADRLDELTKQAKQAEVSS